ncbi:UbiA prenyltransferase family [Cynara cardunculus var. scolymus]|uniref:UbiA prenyltransferase family n=1 Tax=Cynara cardunculus var. scolymus TaxID=59895 RepID=A0A103XEN7_CYNCS|nr:UbiA prenyltransferase family [Cynara cardunculus var. scolymus]
MESLQIRSVLRPSSSSQYPLVQTAVASRHGEVEFSRVRGWKTIRTELSSVKFERANHLQSGKLSIDENVHTQFHQHQRQKTRFQANVVSEFSHDAQDSGAVGPQINVKSLVATLGVIYRYSRAYTVNGTPIRLAFFEQALSILSISLLAVQKLSDFKPSFFLGVFQAIIGGCLANLYVVGINQLSDIEIDKVNKPYLPLASGELSVKTGVLLTSLYAILRNHHHQHSHMESYELTVFQCFQGFFLGWSVNSWPLKLGLFLWYAFGTAYSVHIPLLRWKRIPALAALCIWSVQGAIIPILFHLHAQRYANVRPLFLSKHAIFVCGFMSIYAVVIALFKDVPDVEGDKINGITSFASQVGKKRVSLKICICHILFVPIRKKSSNVFWICIWLLEMAYGMAMLIGLSSTRFWIRSIMVIGHCILGFILWEKANSIDLKSNEAIESFYLFIWKLYYAEYLLVPILRF